MENLVNKKVRLQNRLTKTTLVACSDKKSVNHIRLDDNKPKPENSVWIIKSKHPDYKAIRLESVYGKLLAWKTSAGGIAKQVDNRPPVPPHDREIFGVHNWWTFEDVDQSGFTCVRIQSSLITIRRCANLYPDSSNAQVKVGQKRESSSTSRLVDRDYIWDLEFVEDPIIDPGPGPGPDPVISKPEDNPPVTLPVVEGTIPSTNYTYQVDRMYVYQEGKAGTLFPFPNYANTGRNVNKSGTQIVGGVNIHTHIDNFITWVSPNGLKTSD